MIETKAINNSLPENENYEILLEQINVILNPEEPLISNLANVTALLKQTFKKISWVGFYFLKDGKLFLGPFQGKVACTIIQLGRGVCGTSASLKETIIVDDVDKFPGHIACDSRSRSEIVIPLMEGEKIIGILDLDSYSESAFNKTDQIYLEKILSIITDRLKTRLLNTSEILL